MKGKLLRYLMLAVISVAGAFAVIFLTRGYEGYALDREIIGIPAEKVGERRASIEKYGISLNDKVEGTNPRVLVTSISDSDWAKKYETKLASASMGAELVASSDIKELLWKEVAAPPADSYKWPDRYDFNVRNVERNTQRAAGSIDQWISSRLAVADYDAAISGLEWLDQFSQILARSPDENALVLWFAVNLDVLRIIERIKSEGALTPERLTKIQPMLSHENRAIDYQRVVYQKIRESVATTRALPLLNEDDIYSLIVDKDDQVVPKFDSKTLLAIESKLLSVWEKVIPIASDVNHNSEEIGIEIDRVVEANQKSMKASDFMIQAIPDSFEQFGRIVFRITQAKAIMNYWIVGNIEPGTSTIGTGKDRVVIEVEDRGRDWVITSKAPYAGLGFRENRGLEINQSEGAQLLVAK